VGLIYDLDDNVPDEAESQSIIRNNVEEDVVAVTQHCSLHFFGLE
jgi:hypothetical protein